MQLTYFCCRCTCWLPLDSFAWRDKGHTRRQAMCRQCRRKYDRARRLTKRNKAVARWAGRLASAKPGSLATAAEAGFAALGGPRGLALAIRQAMDHLPLGSPSMGRLLCGILRLMPEVHQTDYDRMSDEELRERIRQTEERMKAEIRREMAEAKG